MTCFRGIKVAFRRRTRLAVAVAASGVVAAVLNAPNASAAPPFCTYDFPVAPANARCVNYSYSSFEGGYCYLNRPAFTADGRAIPSSCAYYDNTRPGMGRPPNPQMVPPGSTPSPLAPNFNTPDPAAVPATPAPTSTTSQAPLRLPSVSDATADRPGSTAHLVGVRLAQNDGFDRLVLEFADRVPSYKVGYRPLPAFADPSGKQIPLPGAETAVRVTLNGATGNGGGPDGEQTYFGSSIVLEQTRIVTEAKAAGDFENVLSWVVGLRSETPFSVLVLAGPPRLVIDFVH